MKAEELFEEQLRVWGLQLETDVRTDLLRYARLLLDYEAANVVGAKTYEDVLLDHVLDSLSCLLYGPIFEARALVDVGSGGGLPGIPLKIFRKDLRVTLVEATRKKVRFLQSVAEKLELDGLELADARVEELARDDRFRSAYDCATARAVASLPVLLEYCVPLLRRGESFIAMKGRVDPGEMDAGDVAAAELGATRSEIIDVPMLPEIGDKARSLVIYRKTSDTPRMYPRRTGLPSKRPLGRSKKRNAR